MNVGYLTPTQILKQTPAKPRRRLIKVTSKGRKKANDLEEKEEITVAPTVIKDRRKRGVEKALKEMIEGDIASESNSQEVDLAPKRKQLVKNGPILSKAMKVKKEKTTSKKLKR